MTSRACALGLAMFVFAASSISAQTTSSDAARTKTGKAQIIGVVLDSLNGGFLKGADVLLEPAQRNTETDTAGRFSFDTLAPGNYRLGVFHPLLDALDLSIATKPFHAAADSASVVILAVPSPRTIVLGRCGNRNKGNDTSAVLGHVSDPETLEPIAGAEVSVAWTEIEVSRSFGIRSTPHIMRDTTSKDGSFRVCGLPSALQATLKAQRGAAVTGEIPFSMGNRSIEVIARDLLLAKADSTMKTGSSTVSGVVRLEGNPPNMVSRVELEGTDIAAVTNEKGEFTLHNLPAGSRNILARHLGYAAQSVPVDLNPREPQRVTISLPKYVAVMDPVLVTARRNMALDKVGFVQRQKSGLGYFMGPDRLAQMHPFYVTDILRMVPGIHIGADSRGAPIVTSTRDIRSGCVQYYVDDVPFAEIEPGDINTFITGGEIVAVEVYQSGTIPAQYMRSGGSCTTIVMWTRFKIRS